MYVTSNGVEVYETLEDLIHKGITGVCEDQDNYYVGVKKNDYYDTAIWIVNKKTLKVSLGDYIDFMLDIEDKAKPVDPEILMKRVS